MSPVQQLRVNTCRLIGHVRTQSLTKDSTPDTLTRVIVQVWDLSLVALDGSLRELDKGSVEDPMQN